MQRIRAPSSLPDCLVPGNLHLLPADGRGSRVLVVTASNRLHNVMLQTMRNVKCKNCAVRSYPSVSAWRRYAMNEKWETTLTLKPTTEKGSLYSEDTRWRKIWHSDIPSRNPLDEWSACLKHLHDNTQHPQEKNIHVLNSVRTSDPRNRKDWDLHFRGLKIQNRPITGPRWPECSTKLRLSDYVTKDQVGVQVVSLTHRQYLPPGNNPGSRFC